MNEFILYVFLNTIPVTAYSFGPGTVISPDSFIKQEACNITEITMDESDNITIECVTATSGDVLFMQMSARND